MYKFHTVGMANLNTSKEIFSMSFFDFQRGDAAGVVSAKFWVYLACTIPLTLVLLVLWFLWQQVIKHLLSERDSQIQAVETEHRQKERQILEQPLNGFEI